MAAGRFVVPPYFPARDRDFNLLSGALLYVYDNETTIKARIYTDVGLSVLSSNPVVANSSGQFPAIYADAGTEAAPVLYSVSVTTSTGASPGNPFNFDNYRPAVDWETAALALAEAAAEAASASAIDAAASADEAEAAAVITSADLAAIEAIAAGAPDAPSIVNKADRDGSNLTGTQPAEFLAVLNGVSLTALAASTGSGLVGFLQAGTGAVLRTSQAKMRDIVSGGDFDVTGDGVADDTAKLQALLNAAAGGVATLPKKGATYKITDTLIVPANTTIDAQNSTIVSTMTTGDDAILFVDGGGARDLTLVGPYPSGGTYAADNNGIACRGTNNSPSAPTFVVAPVFENVEVYGYGHTGIRLQYCKNSFSANVVVRNCGYAGVGGLSCENVWIDGYRADNITPGFSTDAYGVFFDRSEAGTLTADPTSYRCGATNVIITNVRGGGNGQGVDSHGGVEIVFEGIVNDCDVAGAFTASSVGGSQVIGPKRCRAKITGESNNEGYGFFVVGAVSGGSTIDYAEDCEVDLNLTGYGKEIADGSIGAGYFFSTKQLKVRGQLKNPRSCGLYFGKDNYGLDVDVAVTDPNSTAFSAAGCIRVVGINNTGRIRGIYHFENAALAIYVAVTSIRVEAGLTGLDLDFGPSGFYGLSATRLNAQFGTTTGVRYYGMQTQTGGADITASSGVADGVLDVTFAKRFPYVPSVQATLNFPVNGGGKFPILAVRDVLVTETGFRIYAYPTDGTTWSATGTIPFRWEAK